MTDAVREYVDPREEGSLHLRDVSEQFQSIATDESMERVHSFCYINNHFILASGQLHCLIFRRKD